MGYTIWTSALQTSTGDISQHKTGTPYSYAGMKVDSNIELTASATWKAAMDKLHTKVKRLRLTRVSLPFRHTLVQSMIMGTIRFYATLIPTIKIEVDKCLPLIRKILIPKNQMVAGGFDNFVKTHNALLPTRHIYTPKEYVKKCQMGKVLKDVIIPYNTTWQLTNLVEQHGCLSFLPCSKWPSPVKTDPWFWCLLITELAQVANWPGFHGEAFFNLPFPAFSAKKPTTLALQSLKEVNQVCPVSMEVVNTLSPIYNNSQIRLPTHFPSTSMGMQRVLPHTYIGTLTLGNLINCPHFPICCCKTDCKRTAVNSNKMVQIPWNQADSWTPVTYVPPQHYTFKTYNRMGNPQKVSSQPVPKPKPKTLLSTHLHMIKASPGQKKITNYQMVNLSGNPISSSRVEHPTTIEPSKTTYPVVMFDPSTLAPPTSTSNSTWRPLNPSSFPQLKGLIVKDLLEAEVWLHTSVRQELHLNPKHCSMLAVAVPNILNIFTNAPTARWPTECLPDMTRNKVEESKFCWEFTQPSFTQELPQTVTDLWTPFHLLETQSLCEFIRKQHPQLFSLHLRSIAAAWTTRSFSKHWEDSHSGECNLCFPYDDVQQSPQHLVQCPHLTKWLIHCLSKRKSQFVRKRCGQHLEKFVWGVLTSPVDMKYKAKLKKLYIMTLKLRSRIWNDFVSPGVQLKHLEMEEYITQFKEELKS